MRPEVNEKYIGEIKCVCICFLSVVLSGSGLPLIVEIPRVIDDVVIVNISFKIKVRNCV